MHAELTKNIFLIMFYKFYAIILLVIKYVERVNAVLFT